MSSAAVIAGTSAEHMVLLDITAQDNEVLARVFCSTSLCRGEFVSGKSVCLSESAFSKSADSSLKTAKLFEVCKS